MHLDLLSIPQSYYRICPSERYCRVQNLPTSSVKLIWPITELYSRQVLSTDFDEQILSGQGLRTDSISPLIQGLITQNSTSRSTREWNGWILLARKIKTRTAERRWMRNPVWPSSCVTPAGTSNELDVQNEWEENTHKHTLVLHRAYKVWWLCLKQLVIGPRM